MFYGVDLIVFLLLVAFWPHTTTLQKVVKSAWFLLVLLNLAGMLGYAPDSAAVLAYVKGLIPA